MISNNYIESKISLNEMGAAWIMRNDFQVFLLNPVEVAALDKVCIRKDNIVVSWNDDKAKAVMNDVKDKLITLFGLNEPEVNIWEDRRDEFLNDFKAYKSVVVEENLREVDPAHMQPKARIVGSSYYNGHGSAEISFTNKGNGTANNLSIKIEECEGFYYPDGDIFPFEFLKPDHCVKVQAHLMESFGGKIKAHIEWEEDDEKYSDVELIQVN